MPMVNLPFGVLLQSFFHVLQFFHHRACSPPDQPKAGVSSTEPGNLDRNNGATTALVPAQALLRREEVLSIQEAPEPVGGDWDPVLGKTLLRGFWVVGECAHGLSKSSQFSPQSHRKTTLDPRLLCHLAWKGPSSVRDPVG